MKMWKKNEKFEKMKIWKKWKYHKMKISKKWFFFLQIEKMGKNEKLQTKKKKIWKIMKILKKIAVFHFGNFFFKTFWKNKNLEKSWQFRKKKK